MAWAGAGSCEELHFDDFLSDCVEDKVGKASQLEFEHNARPVSLDGAHTNTQLFCDLPIQVPFGQKTQNLIFAIG